MGLFNWFTRSSVKAYQEYTKDAAEESRPSKIDVSRTAVVGASNAADETQVQSFNNSNITFSGELAGYDYSKILRDKQNNIVN